MTAVIGRFHQVTGRASLRLFGGRNTRLGTSILIVSGGTFCEKRKVKFNVFFSFSQCYALKI